MQIRQILDKIDDSQLFVPAFQREYVWKRQNVKALFNSLIKKYPTGTLLTWETTRPPELKGPRKYVPDMGAIKLILDGQQRITTIYMIMKGILPPYYTSDEITNPVMGLHVNLLTLELEYYKAQQMANNPIWVNLTDIFNGNSKSREIRAALRDTNTLDNETEDLLDRNFETIKGIQDREFQEQIIPVSANIKEAIDIFYIVNASGVNLTDAELALAQICGYWPEARELFKVKLEKLRKVGFDLKLDLVIYVLLGILHGIGSDMKRLHGEENRDAIKSAWAKLDSQVLDYVVGLLKTHAFVDHSDEINSPFALVPLIAYAFEKAGTGLTEDDIRRAVKWFFYAQLRQRYVSQTAQKLDKDLGVVRSSATPFDDMLGIIQAERSLDITKEEFVGRDIRHPLFSLMRWYFKSRNAVCLGTGIGLRQAMGPRYALEKDHIFPYSALRDNGYEMENRFKYALAQELTNRAILTTVENRSKSATAAEEYLSKVLTRFPGALEKQCISLDQELWKINRYEDFLDARRGLLASAINDFLSGITETNLLSAPLSISDIIEEGEHDKLEFKSTLRWDTRESCVNRVLEQVILKSIAALSNADGGKLLIGVKDDGTIYGLDSDYDSLGGDRDAFERHLRGLVNNTWGTDRGIAAVSFSFPTVEGQEICVLEVKAAKRPFFLSIADKAGVKTEKLFVRAGNASLPIDTPSQMAAYINERFPAFSANH